MNDTINQSGLIILFVPGIPQPGGSKKAFYNRKTGRTIVVEDAKHNKDWRTSVMQVARDHYQGPPLEGPIRLDVQFLMPRPKSHFGSGKNLGKLKQSAPKFHTSKPDRTKLLRSTEDALTQCGIWRDDTQVAMGEIMKLYSDRPGALIRIKALNE
jgi:crossover junction endodeoxyribonuclease RusA